MSAVTVTLTEAEQAVFCHVLDLAASRLAAAIYNDFELSEDMPDLAERNAFVKAYETANGSPQDYRDLRDPAGEDYRLPDFCIAYSLLRKIRDARPAPEETR